jgi:hypothetical protein
MTTAVQENSTMDQALQFQEQQTGEVTETGTTTTTKPERVFDARQQRINEIRLKFCVRDEFPITKNMIHSDGTLNQEYASILLRDLFFPFCSELWQESSFFGDNDVMLR